MSKKIRSSLDPVKLEHKRNSHSYRGGHSLVISQHYDYESGPNDHTVGLIPLGTFDKTTGRYASRKLVEDTTHNMLDDFDPQEVMDCRYQAGQVVKAINHHATRERQNEARRDFLDQLERINVCPRCRCPIKTLKAVQMLKEKEQVEEKFKPLRRTPYGWNRAAFRIQHYRWDGERVVEYADVKSHYEFWNPPDAPAYYYYVDGTGRDIRLERIPIKYKRSNPNKQWNREDENGKVMRTRYKERFVEHKPGFIGPMPTVIPERGYRLFNIKCECKFRRQPREKKPDPKV